jgi:hypothetical protein
MSRPKLILALLLVGLVAVAIGIYSYLKPREIPVTMSATVQPDSPSPPPGSTRAVTQGRNSSQQPPPNCVISYSSGSCWTIQPPKYLPPSTLPSDALYEQPSVTISRATNSCTLIVPATDENGVRAQDVAGHQFVINRGERIEISATGSVMFSKDHPRVGPLGMNGWYDPYVDSPFNESVGGLEFSIGPLSENRFLVGTSYSGVAEYGGIPVFRIIERLSGYHDGNRGGFWVTVQKR